MTTPINTTAPSTASATSSSSSSAAQNVTFDKDMFLKMLVGEMKNENPMQPTDSSQWVSEMAQFTNTEQVSNMATTNKQISTQLAASQALSLIGHAVTWADPSSGTSGSGTVQKVDIASDGTAALTVDGQGGIGASEVTEVQ